MSLMPAFDPGPERERIDFAAAVTRSFRFLRSEYDFALVDHGPTLVRYVSPAVVVTVYHGRGSFELGVEIGLRDGDATFSLAELIDLREGNGTARGTFQASDPNSTARLVEKLAELTRQDADDALRGDPGTFARLAKQRRRRSQMLTEGFEAADLRESAAAAWADRNLEAVHRAYSRIEALETVPLTRAERKRLAYVRRRLGR
jgi:hypothetical protein